MRSPISSPPLETRPSTLPLLRERGVCFPAIGGGTPPTKRNVWHDRVMRDGDDDGVMSVWGNGTFCHGLLRPVETADQSRQHGRTPWQVIDFHVLMQRVRAGAYSPETVQSRCPHRGG